jgi:hypothetical protein
VYLRVTPVLTAVTVHVLLHRGNKRIPVAAALPLQTDAATPVPARLRVEPSDIEGGIDLELALASAAGGGASIGDRHGARLHLEVRP